jgi:hypothetical protein
MSNSMNKMQMIAPLLAALLLVTACAVPSCSSRMMEVPATFKESQADGRPAGRQAQPAEAPAARRMVAGLQRSGPERA